MILTSIVPRLALGGSPTAAVKVAVIVGAPSSPTEAAPVNAPPKAAPASAGDHGVVGGSPDALPGARLFSERCSTCHNIGSGPKVGPDLLGVVDRRTKAWIAKFVRNPGAAIDGGDPIARDLATKFAGVRMPEQPLTDEELDQVLAYFAACTARGGCTPVATGPKWGTDGSDDEVTRGRDLFLGRRRLQHGGAPCFACHNVRAAHGPGGVANEGVMGGGTLGPDLTFIYARLGEKGLSPALQQMSSPVMRAVYGVSPLELDEQFALKAYFARLARDGTTPPREHDFLLLGLEGMALVVGFVALTSLRKKKGPRS